MVGASTPPKPPSERIRRNKRNDVGSLTLISGDSPSLPDLGEVWTKATDPHPATQFAWDNVRAATHIERLVDTSSDLAELVRWVSLYDDRARAHDAFIAKPVIETRMGDTKVNPMWSVVKHCDIELGKLADRFGLNLIGRMRLGIELAEATKGLSQADQIMADMRQTKAEDVEHVIDVEALHR